MDCRKMRFMTRSYAKKIGKVRGRKLRAYFCDKCNAWHLTSMPKEEFERIQHRKIFKEGRG